VALDRERAGREASPSAAIVDSQTVKATEAPAPRAFDGGKKLTGLKRHALVDVDGRLLMIGSSEANLHDSKAGAALLAAARSQYPSIERVWADSAYRGRRMKAAAAPARVEIVAGLVGQQGFVVQPRRWVVERSFVLILSLSKGVQPLAPAMACLRSRAGNHLRHDLRRQRLHAHATHRTMP
jgi:transposase